MGDKAKKVKAMGTKGRKRSMDEYAESSQLYLYEQAGFTNV